LAHRLHAIHFGDPRDRSVRDVVDALTLLVQHPEACPSASERWDHLNCLLQVLKTRWEMRGSVEPKAPRIVLNDLEKSITAVENTFELMDILCAEARMSESDWQLRRAYSKIDGPSIADLPQPTAAVSLEEGTGKPQSVARGLRVGQFR
jgi:hypothetical protein